MVYELRNRILSGVSDSNLLPRPPGAVREMRLAEQCTGCGDCVAICPKQIITLDEDCLPVVNSMQNCGHCGLCADVCTRGAIEFTRETRSGLKHILQAEANDRQVL